MKGNGYYWVIQQGNINYTWHYISPDEEYLKTVVGQNQVTYLIQGTNRKFRTLEAAKAAVESAYKPTEFTY